MAEVNQSAAPKKGVSMPVTIIAAVAALVVGVLVGHFALGGLLAGGLNGKTTLSEGELDTTVATYVYNGQTNNITARQAIESQTTLDASKNADGTYAVPSAEYAVSLARNNILSKEVEAKGITVSDDDVTAYAESTLGTSDFATIASQYSMSEDQVKAILKQSCGTKKLYDTVVTDTTTGTAPVAPDSPADGNNDAQTPEYGAYIVGLLGDEWDSTNQTWARTDGPFYASMSDQTFTADAASYTQAQTAYYVAYQQYAQTSTDASTQWSDYVNTLLSKASINVLSLVS